MKKLVGGVALVMLLPMLVVLAAAEPSFLGELGVWTMLPYLGVASFAGWLLSRFTKN